MDEIKTDLVCPFCNSINDIEWEDTYDRYSDRDDTDNVDTVVEQSFGSCRECGNVVKFESVYKFIGYRNIEKGVR